MAGFNNLIPSQSIVLEARAQEDSLFTRLPAEFTAVCYPYRFFFIHPITTTTYHWLKLHSGAFVGITIPPLMLHSLQKYFMLSKVAIPQILSL